MRKGRYNIEIDDFIKKYNVYMNDYCVYFIFYKGNYVPIESKQRYKGGWLWRLREKKK